MQRGTAPVFTTLTMTIAAATWVSEAGWPVLGAGRTRRTEPEKAQEPEHRANRGDIHAALDAPKQRPSPLLNAFHRETPAFSVADCDLEVDRLRLWWDSPGRSDGAPDEGWTNCRLAARNVDLIDRPRRFQRTPGERAPVLGGRLQEGALEVANQMTLVGKSAVRGNALQRLANRTRQQAPRTLQALAENVGMG